jgi:hypothetical protein
MAAQALFQVMGRDYYVEVPPHLANSVFQLGDEVELKDGYHPTNSPHFLVRIRNGLFERVVPI